MTELCIHTQNDDDSFEHPISRQERHQTVLIVIFVGPPAHHHVVDAVNGAVQVVATVEWIVEDVSEVDHDDRHDYGAREVGHVDSATDTADDREQADDDGQDDGCDLLVKTWGRNKRGVVRH